MSEKCPECGAEETSRFEQDFGQEACMTVTFACLTTAHYVGTALEKLEQHYECKLQCLRNQIAAKDTALATARSMIADVLGMVGEPGTADLDVMRDALAFSDGGTAVCTACTVLLRELALCRDHLSTRIFHDCANGGKVRTYPAMLCSLCEGVPDESADFDAAEEITRLREELAEANRMLVMLTETGPGPCLIDDSQEFAGRLHELYLHVEQTPLSLIEQNELVAWWFERGNIINTLDDKTCALEDKLVEARGKLRKVCDTLQPHVLRFGILNTLFTEALPEVLRRLAAEGQPEPLTAADGASEPPGAGWNDAEGPMVLSLRPIERYRVKGKKVRVEGPQEKCETCEPFNALPSRRKWEEWQNQVGDWICQGCGEVLGDGPNRASPIPRASICCSTCDYELTRRTGGGQLDPFGWDLRPKCDPGATP